MSLAAASGEPDLRLNENGPPSEIARQAGCSINRSGSTLVDRAVDGWVLFVVFVGLGDETLGGQHQAADAGRVFEG